MSLQIGRAKDPQWDFSLQSPAHLQRCDAKFPEAFAGVTRSQSWFESQGPNPTKLAPVGQTTQPCALHVDQYSSTNQPNSTDSAVGSPGIRWLLLSHISSTLTACSRQTSTHASHFVQSPGLVTWTSLASMSKTSSGHILKHSPWFLPFFLSTIGKYLVHPRVCRMFSALRQSRFGRIMRNLRFTQEFVFPSASGLDKGTCGLWRYRERPRLRMTRTTERCSAVE